MAEPSLFSKAYRNMYGWWRGGIPPVPLPKPFEEQGSGGTSIWGGFVQLTDKAPKWVGQEKWRTARDLATNVSVVATGIHYLANLISGPKWRAEPADAQNPEAVRYANLVTDILADPELVWPNVVRQASMFRFHGFSIQEWIAKHRPDGTIGLKAVELRPQHTVEQWAVDNCGTVLGVFQRNPMTNELLGLPRAKILYLVEDTLTDSPEGLGVLRQLGEPAARLKRLLELEVRAYERDLRGTPIGRAPISAIRQAVKAQQLTQAEGEALLEHMKNMVQLQVKQSDTGLLLDSATYMSTTAGGPAVSDIYHWSLDLLNGPGLGLAEISTAIERLNREMARLIGVEHLLLGDQGGSRAVAQDKSRNVYLIASSVLSRIVASVQNDIIRPLWALNAFPMELMPRLVAEDIAPRDVVEIGTTLARMAQSGAVLAPNDPVINDVRNMLGVSHAPPVPEEEQILGNDNVLPKMLPLLSEVGVVDEGVDPKELPREAPPGEGDKPLLSPEMQRLPRLSAANSDLQTLKNGKVR